MTNFNVPYVFQLSNPPSNLQPLLVMHLDSDSVDADLVNKKLVNGDSFIPSDSQATLITC